MQEHLEGDWIKPSYNENKTNAFSWKVFFANAQLNNVSLNHERTAQCNDNLQAMNTVGFIEIVN